MRLQTIRRTKTTFRFKAAHLTALLALAAALLLSVSAAMAEPAHPPRHCDLTGTWYGGSIVAYQMTIVPAGTSGRYSVVAEGMYKNSVINTIYTGLVARKHDRYQGPLMQLTTSVLAAAPCVG